MNVSAEPTGTGDNPEQRTVTAETRLPPVEPPTASFLIQLFLIPMIIVVIIVSIWGFFSWLVNARTDPYDLVKNIRSLNDASWQSAFLLSDLLRNPEYHAIKADAELARQLAAILQDELAAGRMEDQRIKLRVFLCRALGEFQVPDVIPPLIAAARTERHLRELDVRRSAVEGLAVLAGQWDRDQVATHPEVVDVLIAVSHERSDGPESRARDDLRATAAFALGVLRTPAALERLAQMLDDAHANTRYNAATGLARAGDPRAVPVLLEMLDPDNPEAIAAETTADGQQRKRQDVLTTAIAATVRLAQVAPQHDMDTLRKAIARLRQPDQPRIVRLQAEEASQLLSR